MAVGPFFAIGISLVTAMKLFDFDNIYPGGQP